MGATGIGAPVRRKEDQRFITGRGHYTDDINRPGQAHAYFLRSPHAHARVKQIDGAAAAAMPGVLAVLTGADLAADKIGNLICGWMINSKDGSPMKMAAHPAIAQGKANFVGDAVALVIAETLAQAMDAAEKVNVAYEVLAAAVDPAKAQAADAPQIHDIATRNTIYQWHLGDAHAVDLDAAAGNAQVRSGLGEHLGDQGQARLVGRDLQLQVHQQLSLDLAYHEPPSIRPGLSRPATRTAGGSVRDAGRSGTAVLVRRVARLIQIRQSYRLPSTARSRDERAGGYCCLRQAPGYGVHG